MRHKMNDSLRIHFLLPIFIGIINFVIVHNVQLTDFFIQPHCNLSKLDFQYFSH